jgi:hypothetical protein
VIESEVLGGVGLTSTRFLHKKLVSIELFLAIDPPCVHDGEDGRYSTKDVGHKFESRNRLNHASMLSSSYVRTTTYIHVYAVCTWYGHFFGFL